MPFVIAAGVPHSKLIGTAQSTCRACGQRHRVERRWHTLWLMFLPLFAMRERVVVTCPKCHTESGWKGELPRRSPQVPLVHRLGFAIPVVALVGFLAAKVVPYQLRMRAEAQLKATPAGQTLYSQLKETSVGCEGQPYAAFNALACELMHAAEKEAPGRASSGARIVGLEGSAGVIVTLNVSGVESSKARELGQLARTRVQQKLPKGATVVVVVKDFDDPRWVTVGKDGSFLEEAGGRVDLTQAVAALSDLPR